MFSNPAIARLPVARGSLHELEAVLDLVVALEYFRDDELSRIGAALDECAKTVYGPLAPRRLGTVFAAHNSLRHN